MKCFILAVGLILPVVNARPQTATSGEAIDYGPMAVAGAVTDRNIDESSGLAAARHPETLAQFPGAGALWTHNDSGDTPRLFLLSARGTLLAEYGVDVPFATDWEDMCSFEVDGQPYLLVGDVGDNGHKRPRLTLWLIPEPGFDPERRSAFPLKMKPERRIDIAFADGPWDCESVAFDPERREIVLITKVDPRRPPVGFAGVYVLPLPPEAPPEATPEGSSSGWDDAGGPIVLDRATDLRLRIVTAADISPDGRRLVAATYGDAWQFVRGEEESWAEALARPGNPGVPIELGPRGQSETVAFGGDGVTLWLTAEKVGRPLWKVEAANGP